jgi:SAM-dependent methyltransferase
MDYQTAILTAISDESRFVRLVFSGPSRSSQGEWRKIVVRPVMLAAGRALQAVLEAERKESRRTLQPDDAGTAIGEFFAMHFRHIHLLCTDEDLHVRITRKGKALVKVGKPSVTELPVAASHDRAKEYPIPPDKADPFLERLGIMRKGRVRASMQDKFRQINHFLEILSHTRLLREGPLEGGDGALRIVDCGCGRALLTFAACHYLRDIMGKAVACVGVDANAEVIASAEKLRATLDEADMELVHAAIAEYDSDRAPNLVFSLHACDTATDEALARGVAWKADLIMAVPCCQHELHHSLDRPEFRAILQHGILRERTADILTDALRAAALRVMGYKADVIEFISPGHTAKNLMIRAERVRGIDRQAFAREYLALREFWGVQPAIERLLGEEFQARLS